MLVIPDPSDPTRPVIYFPMIWRWPMVPVTHSVDPQYDHWHESVSRKQWVVMIHRWGRTYWQLAMASTALSNGKRPKSGPCAKKKAHGSEPASATFTSGGTDGNLGSGWVDWVFEEVNRLTILFYRNRTNCTR